MRTRRSLALFGAVAVLPFALGHAATKWVSTTGTNIIGCGLTQGTACRTIQFAYDDALAGDELHVLPGTYAECPAAWGFDPDPVLSVDKPVQILAEAWVNPVGTPDNTVTVISGTGVCDGISNLGLPVVSIGGTNARLEGFRITGGGLSGVQAQGSVTITNNLIEGNSSDRGGGIYFLSGDCYYLGDTTAVISNNQIRGNTAIAPTSGPVGTGDGGGIFVRAEGVVQNLNPGTGERFCEFDGNPVVTIANNTIQDNTARNDNVDEVALGGGIYAQTDAASIRSSRIVISQNEIFGNDVVVGPDGFGYGGGIWANTFGAGTETIEIEDNTIGDTGTRGGPPSLANTSPLDGGGVSAWATPDGAGNHTLLVSGNTIAGNSANGDGGGLDLFALPFDLGAGNGYDVRATNNDIRDNVAGRGGGGILAALNSEFTADAASGTSNPDPADETTFLIENNRITGNTTGADSAGVLLLPTANADAASPVDDVTGCPEAPCFASLATTALIDFSTNYVADNSTVGGVSSVVGAGILVFPAAIGDAAATVRVRQSTIAGNLMNDGFVGGIEVEATTCQDCNEPFVGEARLEIEDTVVFGNDGFGIGGPPPQGTDLTVTVDSSSVWGNNTGTGLFCFGGTRDTLSCATQTCPGGICTQNGQFETSLFPSSCVGGANANQACTTPAQCPGGTCSQALPPLACMGGTNAGQVCNTVADCPGGACRQSSPTGNVFADPLIDPASFFPGICSPVFTAGAGFLRNPNTDGDLDLDGLDLLDTAVSFGADSLAVRFNAATDLDRNGQTDGNDLMPQTDGFGQVCP